MPTVQTVLAKKGGQVVSAGVDDSVLRAAALMNDRGIGGLVVLDGDRVAGIFTERDILRRVVAVGRDPAKTQVREVMTSPVAFCRRETTLAECRYVMTERRIRHLPVVDEHGVCGIVTIGDLMAHEATEHQATIQYLHEYIFGVR
ncbi:MAG: CBS domain-containing protein [Candidatus Eisenbacteria bacterium]|uniref:CBS domain-containing protein n=1 Tax=Eiseniibacteriota bacterium TaxID=2212470 RepID=A0A538U318_UNCEI|nr:MAG: CBS domain-containing protein [Candidatus Eisenbacteria bacterium]